MEAMFGNLDHTAELEAPSVRTGKVHAFQRELAKQAVVLQQLGRNRCQARRVLQIRKNTILALARNGIAICAYAPGASVPPKDTHGYLDATTDDKTIRRWFKEYPGMNYGIATGRESGIVALDIDMPTGFDQLRALVNNDVSIAAQLAIGVAVRSPSGGVHLWLPAPDTELRSGPIPLYPKVEIKAERTALTGPLSWRKESNGKSAGMYIPTIANKPDHQMELLGLPKDLRDKVMIELAGGVKATPAKWLVGWREMQVVPHSTPRESVRVSTPAVAKRVNTENAELWLNGRLDTFCKLEDEHNADLHRIVWRCVFLECHGALTEEDSNKIFNGVKDKVLYSNNQPRTTPYQFDANLRSARRRVKELRENDPEKFNDEMFRQLRGVQWDLRQQTTAVVPPIEDESVKVGGIAI